GTRTTRAVLLIVQTAFSIVLIVASGLLVESLLRLNAVALGFEPAGLVMTSFPLVTTALSADPTIATSLGTRLSASRPGTEIAFASTAPFGAVKVSNVMVPGSTYHPPTDRDMPQMNDVTPAFFKVMRMRTTWGRTFTDADLTGDPVSVVSATMA